jgi:nuclear transport factor 2 (NTF2) superfamily protein
MATDGGIDLEDVQRWIDGYVRAWHSNDPADVEALFADNAMYYTHPSRDPWRGRDEIIREWTGNPDPENSWRSHYRAIAATGRTGVVRGHTSYLKDDGSIDREYANVYLIEFDPDGRASEFVEFFMLADPAARS